MVFSALEQTDQVPFHHVLIHGLVRDSQGRKMSKSLGNGIDPLEVIDKYGADALRLTLMTGNAPGNDMRFYWERVESSRNFANKIWNASRFVLMNLEGKDVTEPEIGSLCAEDKWILSRLNNVIKEVTDNMEKYELGIAVQKIYDFLWDELCDWYIEIAKVRLWKAEEDPKAANEALWTLRTALTQGLKLLHPFMPFITEELWQQLREREPGESLMVTQLFEPVGANEQFLAEFEVAKEIISNVRSIRLQKNIALKEELELQVVGTHPVEKLNPVIIKMCNLSSVTVVESKSEGASSFMIGTTEFAVPLGNMIDVEAEIARMEAELKHKEGFLQGVMKKLSNEKFVNNAPAAVLELERKKQADAESIINSLKESIAALKKS